jgi:pyruvate kinase
MAHGSFAEHDARVRWIRQIEQDLKTPLGILIDLGGPKIRLGELKDGALECQLGMQVTFVLGETAQQVTDLPVSYPEIVAALREGDRVVLADGTVTLQVIDKSENRATCVVTQPGIVRSRQGINLPGVRLPLAAITKADREALDWALQRDIDFVGLSFVRTPDDIRQLRQLISNVHNPPQIVAKIEKPEALDCLDEILDLADAVMVARGDLGVEIDIAEVAIVQKRILAAAKKFRKPAIVATQMLESMQRSRIPTRAEVSDVTNAILDGADACMLSGETAVGNYPVESVTMMHRIALATESVSDPPVRPHTAISISANPTGITEASVWHAGLIAQEVGAKMMIILTRSGQTALTIAKHRFRVPTIGVSESPQILRRMCLYWGIIPLAGAPLQDSQALLRFATEWGKREGLVASGDRVVFVYGTGLVSSAHNTVSVFVAD